jgi:outer membrane protein OmpA-like peptidoglycan-associated protein
VEAVVPASFQIFKNGSMKIEDDQGFPALRGFPSFPAEKVGPGAKWTAPGSRAVDPLHRGEPVIIPLVAEYEYKGIELYKDIPVHRISARYASRYQGRDFKLQGTHGVDILVQVSDGLPLMMRDSLDETYSWPDGTSIRFRGFTLTFGQGSVPLDHVTMIPTLEKSLGLKEQKPPPPPVAVPEVGPEEDIDVKLVPEGIRLTIKDIRFVADKDIFLPDEKPRLDKIADALKQIPNHTILVEGHTAAVGRPDDEMKLSIQRAQRMVEELTRRGIGADRFIYKGWGGQKPLGNNADENGRRRNRRVEITILE